MSRAEAMHVAACVWFSVDAEYTFTANFVPGRHLSRFRDVSREKAQVKFIEKCKPGDIDTQIPARYEEDSKKLID
jgi:hypothetical protein